MRGPGRNDPCPCGSGRKAKRCCGVQRGPGEADLARGYLASAARVAAFQLRDLPDDELEIVFDELFDLPTVDLAITITLPKLRSPALARLLDAVADDDVDAGEEEIAQILDRLDTPVERARIAGVITDLRYAGRIDELIAAAAIIDLSSRSRFLMRACLLHAAFVDAGIMPTPGGLRLAA